MEEIERKGLTVAKAALYLPTMAAFTAFSYVLHTGVSTAVFVYSALWRRHHGAPSRRALRPSAYYAS
jgi:hypothetical protein